MYGGLGRKLRATRLACCLLGFNSGYCNYSHFTTPFVLGICFNLERQYVRQSVVSLVHDCDNVCIHICNCESRTLYPFSVSIFLVNIFSQQINYMPGCLNRKAAAHPATHTRIGPCIYIYIYIHIYIYIYIYKCI